MFLVPPVASSEELSRDEVIREVLANHPGIAAMEVRTRGASELASVAGSLPDPTIMVEAAPLTFDHSTPGAGVEVRQMLPRRSVRAARERAATGRVGLDDAMTRERALDLTLDAALLYDELYTIDRALEINRHHQESIGDLAQSAEAMYIVGTASQQDPLQAEVFGSRLEVEAIELEAKRMIVAGRLNVLMNRDPDAALESVGLSPSGAEAISRSAGEDFAGAPAELLLLDARIDTARAELELVRAESKPSFEAMGKYSSMWQGSDHRLMIGAGIRWPFRSSINDAKIAAAAAELRSLEFDRESVERESSRAIDEAVLLVASAARIVELYRDRLLPATRDQAEAARLGFEAGLNDFVAAINAENALREMALRYHEAVANLSSARARLAHASGRIPGLEETQ